MRVLHIGLACAFGGAETFLSTLIREQRRLGIQADAFFTTDLGASKQFEGLCWVGFADKEMLADTLLRNDYDIIHLSNHAVPWAHRSIRWTKYDAPIVVTYHSIGRYETKVTADAVVAVSKAVARHIESHAPVVVRVIYNGVDTEVFYPGDAEKLQRPVMAWVGRSNDIRKDICGLVAVSMTPIAREFQIVVVDGSPDGEECSRHWLPLDAIVEVRKPADKMPDFYRMVAASRGFILSTSRIEAHPINLLEAQACGCPVIAPSVGGIPEAVEHLVTGYIYEPECGAQAVVEGIKWLYNSDNYERTSKAAVERIKQFFNSRRMCQEYLDVYAELVGKRRRGLGRRFFHFGIRAVMPVVRGLVRAYQRSKN
ncbi:MAG: glycosyltransferase family 4 protein [Armatimonadota bacterium]